MPETPALSQNSKIVRVHDKSEIHGKNKFIIVDDTKRHEVINPYRVIVVFIGLNALFDLNKLKSQSVAFAIFSRTEERIKSRAVVKHQADSKTRKYNRHYIVDVNGSEHRAYTVEAHDRAKKMVYSEDRQPVPPEELGKRHNAVQWYRYGHPAKVLSRLAYDLMKFRKKRKAADQTPTRKTIPETSPSANESVIFENPTRNIPHLNLLPSTYNLFNPWAASIYTYQYTYPLHGLQSFSPPIQTYAPPTINAQNASINPCLKRRRITEQQEIQISKKRRVQVNHQSTQAPVSTLSTPSSSVTDLCLFSTSNESRVTLPSLFPGSPSDSFDFADTLDITPEFNIPGELEFRDLFPFDTGSSDEDTFRKTRKLNC